MYIDSSHKGQSNKSCFILHGAGLLLNHESLRLIPYLCNPSITTLSSAHFYNGINNCKSRRSLGKHPFFCASTLEHFVTKMTANATIGTIFKTLFCQIFFYGIINVYLRFQVFNNIMAKRQMWLTQSIMIYMSSALLIFMKHCMDFLKYSTS